MKIGYIYASRDHEKTQTEILKKAGCEEIVRDWESDKQTSLKRPGLGKLLSQLQHGQVIVVSELDRLSRSLRDLIDVLYRIDIADAYLHSLNDDLKTKSASGREVLRSIIEFERRMRRERAKAGLRTAIADGKRLGRPRSLDARQRAKIAVLHAEGESAAEIARIFGVHRATITRALDEMRQFGEDTDLDAN